MQTKITLLATAAMASLLLPATAYAGSAAHQKHHHIRHTVRKAHVVSHSAVDATGGLRQEVDSLKAEVASLHQELDAQRQQSASTQAQLAETQTQVGAVHSQVAASVDVARAEVKSQIHSAIEAEHRKDHIDYKGLRITPGGFLELAGIYREHYLGQDLPSSFQNIPFPNSRPGQLSEGRFSARQSRLSFLAEGAVNPTTKLSMYGEFDFLGAAQTANSNESNSYNPRIRHLYATIDWTKGDGGIHLLAGQNWSLVTLNSKGITPRNEITPPQIDAQYVPGFAWARQPQVRLTADTLNHSLWFAVSAENAATTTAGPVPSNVVANLAGSGGFNSVNSYSYNNVPDFVGKVAYEGKIAGRTLHLEGFGLYRTFTERLTNGTTSTTSGHGYGGSIMLQVAPSILDIQFSIMHGRGIGRYGSSQLADVTYRPDGTIQPLQETMLLGGVTLHATKMLDIYGFAGEEYVASEDYGSVGGTLYGYGNSLLNNTGCLTEGGTCAGNNQKVRQATAGFWQKIYQGSFGRAQVGIQYSYTERSLFTGVGGAPTTSDNMAFLSFRYYPF